MKRVAISYSDGQYSMWLASSRKFRDGMTALEQRAWIVGNTIEIPDAEWDAYQSYLALDRYWAQRIGQLDNIILDRANDQSKQEDNQDGATVINMK